jgi:hypothetical protein
MENIRDVYFGEDTNLEDEINKIQAEGWRITGAEPIEKIKVEIVGRRFILEK